MTGLWMVGLLPGDVHQALGAGGVQGSPGILVQSVHISSVLYQQSHGPQVLVQDCLVERGHSWEEAQIHLSLSKLYVQLDDEL